MSRPQQAPRQVLVLSLEPSQHYPEHSQAATKLVPELDHALTRDGAPAYVFETLPFLWEAAAEKARYQVAEHDPDYVFLLTNEPNHMEILLHRYAGPHYNTDFPDNAGTTGKDPDPEAIPCISKSEVFKLHQHWMEQSGGDAGVGREGLAHVTMAMSGNGGVECEVFRELILAYADEPRVIARLGVPPIAPQHEILKPDTLARTLAFLMEAEYRFQQPGV
ncbi:MAG: hypothetical protein AAGG01_21550 [Planctomycetota bacterium]